MQNRGFTLLELTVVSAIMILLSGIVLSNYRVGEREYTLLRSAQKLAQDLRRAEELALSAKSYPGAPSSFKGGFGVNFPSNSTSSYTLFADLNNNKVFDAGEDLETLNLEKKVKITGLSASPLNIVFLPPDPQVCISGNCPAISEAQITLSLETDSSKTKTVKVNQIGLITINE
jgi:prepilin-type N-terminal cleavage/methylation domain-containing protein